MSNLLVATVSSCLIKQLFYFRLLDLKCTLLEPSNIQRIRVETLLMRPVGSKPPENIYETLQKLAQRNWLISDQPWNFLKDWQDFEDWKRKAKVVFPSTSDILIKVQDKTGLNSSSVYFKQQ